MLLDIFLPSMGGHQVSQMVRHHQEYRDLPILLLSGKDRVVDHFRGRLVGSTGYISRPFEPAEFVWTAKRHPYPKWFGSERRGMRCLLGRA
jgi:twitching motility two-component system response regulator PilG